MSATCYSLWSWWRAVQHFSGFRVDAYLLLLLLLFLSVTTNDYTSYIGCRHNYTFLFLQQYIIRKYCNRNEIGYSGGGEGAEKKMKTGAGRVSAEWSSLRRTRSIPQVVVVVVVEQNLRAHCSQGRRRRVSRLWRRSPGSRRDRPVWSGRDHGDDCFRSYVIAAVYGGGRLLFSLFGSGHVCAQCVHNNNIVRECLIREKTASRFR